MGCAAVYSVSPPHQIIVLVILYMKKSIFSFLHFAPFFWYSKNWLGKAISYLLWPLAYLYGVVMRLRSLCYHLGIFAVHHVDAPVIVVGNITVGGTGKTPLVIWLVNFLREQGLRPGIISRGYGRSSHGVFVVTEKSTPAEVGDEVVMLLQRSHGVGLVVGENRVAAAQQLLLNCDCNVIISDDGLQHLALGRNLEVVVLDGERKLGNELCLPAGPLREVATRLQHVDFVVENINAKLAVTDKSGCSDISPGNCKMQLLADVFCSVKDGVTTKGWQDFISSAIERGKPCHAVAGIGNPARFFQQLRDLGLSVIEHPFPDHHVYTGDDFAFAANDDVVIMTEKDAVKCQMLANENWWYLRVDAKMSDEFAAGVMAKLSTIIASTSSG